MSLFRLLANSLAHALMVENTWISLWADVGRYASAINQSFSVIDFDTITTH
jgi:hypothetical protein